MSIDSLLLKFSAKTAVTWKFKSCDHQWHRSILSPVSASGGHVEYVATLVNTDMGNSAMLTIGPYNPYTCRQNRPA